jgi:phosphogluconate dehydratase
MNPTVKRVTERIQNRSKASRSAYVARIRRAAEDGPSRTRVSCSNLAHAMAASRDIEKKALSGLDVPNIGIVSAYNEMLSAHQPFETYPALIKDAAASHGAVAQFAGGVPAMCDGVTQGQDGMDLSLFSRDVIALSTAVALSHNMFDAAICLGICDKIVPGLLIGALSFGHLPVTFAPAGPMVSGLSNKEKAHVREDFAAGRVGRDELLASESASYHAPGTCTFYGTANSNQMLMEFMGLQLPGGSFVNPGTELREHLSGSRASGTSTCRSAKSSTRKRLLMAWSACLPQVAPRITRFTSSPSQRQRA